MMSVECWLLATIVIKSEGVGNHLRGSEETKGICLASIAAQTYGKAVESQRAKQVAPHSGLDLVKTARCAFYPLQGDIG